MPDLEPQLLRTERLVLRAFAYSDAPEVTRLAGDRAIADTTLNVPHPYEPGVAEAWILGQGQALAEGRAAVFAVTERESSALAGAIGLSLALEHRTAELGYWIGVPFQGRGYATEAARAVLRYGFETLDLNRIHASHMTRNPASCRVMEKVGMRVEGVLREHRWKWGRPEDLEVHGILRAEWGGSGG